MTPPDDMPTVDSDQPAGQERGEKTTTRSGTRGPRSGVRLAALRRAREVKTARDARLRVRELDVETALGQYYEGLTASQEITQRAETRAAEILAEAQAAASTPRQAAMRALRRLKDLGESQASLVELTGMSAAQIRECLAETHPGEPQVPADAQTQDRTETKAGENEPAVASVAGEPDPDQGVNPARSRGLR